MDYIGNPVGETRVAMGSEYPFPLGEEVPGSLIETMPFDERTKELLLGGNAKVWLGME